jgi:tetratricopeptide (TPR) repeat protein
VHRRIQLSVAAFIVVTTSLVPRAALAQDARAGGMFRESYALEAKRDYAAAMARVREARAAGANAYFSAIRLGWLSYLAGDFPGAVTSYTQAIAAEPRAIEAKIALTLPLMAQRNWRELERACMAVLAVDARNVLALARLGLAQYNAGNFPGAETTYRRLADDYPSELDYRTGLGWALLKQGKAADGRSVLEAVLAVSPDNASAKAGLGIR